jgi:hypothetical protein
VERKRTIGVGVEGHRCGHHPQPYQDGRGRARCA